MSANCFKDIKPSQILSDLGIDTTTDEGSELLNQLTNALTNLIKQLSENPSSSSSIISDMVNEIKNDLLDAANNIIETEINKELNNSEYNLPPLTAIIEFHNNSLKPQGIIEGIFFKNRKPIMPGLAETENAKDAHYSTKEDYPNSTGYIDALGNFVKINRKTGQVDIVHFSGTMIQITKSGSVNIYTKKDFQHIVSGNYYLEVKGNIGIKATDINVHCKNLRENVTQKRSMSTTTYVNKAKLVKNKFTAFKEKIKAATYKIDAFYQKSKALLVKVPTFIIKGNEKVSGRRM